MQLLFQTAPLVRRQVHEGRREPAVDPVGVRVVRRQERHLIQGALVLWRRWGTRRRDGGEVPAGRRLPLGAGLHLAGPDAVGRFRGQRQVPLAAGILEHELGRRGGDDLPPGVRPGTADEDRFRRGLLVGPAQAPPWGVGVLEAIGAVVGAPQRPPLVVLVAARPVLFDHALPVGQVESGNRALHIHQPFDGRAADGPGPGLDHRGAQRRQEPCQARAGGHDGAGMKATHPVPFVDGMGMIAAARRRGEKRATRFARSPPKAFFRTPGRPGGGLRLLPGLLPERRPWGFPDRSPPVGPGESSASFAVSGVARERRPRQGGRRAGGRAGARRDRGSLPGSRGGSCPDAAALAPG